MSGEAFEAGNRLGRGVLQSGHRVNALGAVALLVAGACGSSTKNVPCVDNSNCDLTTGGVCVAATTGNKWCAYPDGTCASGLRFSNSDVGDNLGGTCTDLAVHELTVTVGGNGSVTSTPSGITCTGGMCMGSFAVGQHVMLTAAPASTASAFLGWSTDCSGASGCTVTMDQDRRVDALFGVPGQALWAQQFGAVHADESHAVAVDGDGNTIFVGSFSDTISIGTTNLTSAGGTDIVVAKLSADGVVAWAKRFGGTSDDRAVGIATDAANAVYVTGSFQGSMPTGSTTLQSSGGTDGFVLKLDSSGNAMWSKAIGGTQFDSANAIAVRNNTVVVAGAYQGSMVLNGTTVTSSGADDAYLAEYDLSGTPGWGHAFGGNGNDDPNAVALDSNGNVVTAGRFSATGNFGGGPVTSAGGDDIFIAKYAAANGAYLFARRAGGIHFEMAEGVSVDASDNIYVVGMFNDLTDFGGPTPLDGHTNNLFVVKYTQAGAYQWGKSFGDTTTVNGWAVAVSVSGDPIVVGGFCGTVSFGGAALSSVGSCAQFDYDMFAVRLKGSDGSHVNSIRAGGAGLDAAYGVASGSDQRVYLTGAFQGFAEFGGQPHTSAGDNDGIVVALAPL